MRKILFLILLFLLCNFSAETSFTYAKTSDELNNIEMQIYGYNYDNNTESQRLERLEKYAYGGVMLGTLEGRIANLKKDLSISEQKQQTTADKTKPAEKFYDYEEYDYYDNSTLASDSTVQYPVVDVLEEKIFNKA